MDFIVTPEEFEATIRKAGQNPRGPTRASVDEVIRKYRDAYAKNCDGNDKTIYQANDSNT